MWSNAVNSAEWWAFNIATFGFMIGKLQELSPKPIIYTNVSDRGASYANYSIESHSFSEFKNVISRNTGMSWTFQASYPKGDVYIIEIGNTKYVARNFAENNRYDLTIEYWREKIQYGVYRFEY